MKKKKWILLFFIFVQITFGQSFLLDIKGFSKEETKIIDSLNYQKQFLKNEDIKVEVKNVVEKLEKKGFLFVNFKESKLENTFFYTFNLGKNYAFTKIDLAENSSLLQSKNKIIKLRTEEVEDYIKLRIKELDNQGFPLAKIKLENIQLNNNYIEAKLQVLLEKQRNLNEIVIKGYDKFPVGFKSNLKRVYGKKKISSQNTTRIYKDMQQYKFVRTIKQPQILFTKDSTKIYVFVEKAKANTFDGFIGFANDDNNKLVFNGNIDVNLTNIINTGEKISVYWKSNGKDQKTFNLATELPYIFKSPIGIKAQLNIFKQDSLFQNSRTNFDLGYYFNYNTKVFLGYQKQESSDIKNTNTLLLNDYTNTFATLNFEFAKYNYDNILFSEKSNYNLKFGIGKRESKFQTNNQFYINANFKQLFTLNQKNSIAIKNQNYYLQSQHYLTNELYRFGGINSIRGFNENNLQGNLFSALLTEYRYLVSSNLYLHTIIDYGYYQDKTTTKNGNLLGLGFGFGLLTKNGLLNLIYANGSTNNQAIKLSNSIVHISLKTNF